MIADLPFHGSRKVLKSSLNKRQKTTLIRTILFLMKH